MSDTSRTRARVLAFTLLAWAPFVVLWAVFNVVTFETPPPIAVRAAVNAIGWAALLGAAVWRVPRRLPWPRRLRPDFYLQHVGLGVLFAGAWLVGATTTAILMDGGTLADLPESVRTFFEWRMLGGMWLYGFIAGISYAIQAHTALTAQQQAAERSRTLAVRAQLDALEARLNPHFFFNALNALSGLIHTDPDAADDALDRIGRLIRRTLATDGTRLIPLADEWAFTAEYLELERLRLGQRLRVVTCFAPTTEDVLVPPFTLQPLVENAVQYAVADRTAGGTIRVNADRHDGQLTLRVTDDGVRTVPVSLPGGHGLDLLQRRLSVHYVGRAQLTLRAGNAGGCEAVITMPVPPP